MGNDVKPIKKPKWLRALEKQSWQAELLISGATIFSLLSLPEKILPYINVLYIQSSELSFWFILMISLYLFIGLYGMIICFVIHFFIRSLWIALLGLNSVYPDGIKIKPYGLLTEGTMRLVKEEFPDIAAFNQKLDRIGSLMFSIAAFVVMMLTAINVILLVVFGIFALLVKFFPQVTDSLWIIGVVLYALLLLFGMAVPFMRKLKLRDEEKLDKLQFKITKVMGKIVYHIFYYPVNYIVNTLVTNFSFKYAFAFIIMVPMLAGIVPASISLQKTVGDEFSNRNFPFFDSYASRYKSFNYEDELTKSYVMSPIIPSKVISAKQMSIFIPHIYREQIALEKKFGNIEIPSEREKRDDAYQRKLNQHNAFNQIYINDIKYDSLAFKFHTHKRTNQKGVLTYIPTEHFMEGENLLSIKKQYFNKDTIQKIVRIPFNFYKPLN